MQVFELCFSAKKGSTEPFGEKFTAILDEFLYQCVECGLILESGAHSYIEENKYICRIIAQDEDSIIEQNMNRDALELLAALVDACDGMPKLVPCEELVDIPSCSCEKPSYYLLDGCSPCEGSGVKCGDCRLSVPLYRLNPAAENQNFSELLKWRRLYQSVKTQYLLSYNRNSSYKALKDCVSDLNLMGRTIAGRIEQLSGTLTLYPLYSRYEKISDKCPQCGESWVNEYRDAVPYEHFCRGCRIVL